MGEVVFRGFQRSDVPAAHAVMRAVELAESHPLATDIDEVEAVFGEPDFDPALDAWVGMVDDRVVAYARLQRSGAGADFERVYLEGRVHPDHRRRGIGAALLNLQIERAKQVLAAIPNDLPRFIRVASFDGCESALALYRSAGMVPVRWFEDLGRDLVAIPELQPPDGVTIIAFERPDQVRLVHNEAFADHWGSVPASPDYWAHRLEAPGTRLDLSLVAVADDGIDADRIVGYLISSHHPQDADVTGRDSGWIDTLGTLRSWRKRGVASALIVAVLHAYVAAGLDHAMIGVDADNPSGAARLYRALGFEKLVGGVTYELAI